MPMTPTGATPNRIQLRRTKGWRKPEGVIVVARPSKWGNPFAINDASMVWTAVGLGYTGNAAGRRACAVALYRAWLTNEPVELGALAESTEGGHLEFSDGAQISVGEHCMGIARGIA